MSEISREEAIRRIREFGLYHAIGDLPHSTHTVESFNMAINDMEKQIPKKPTVKMQGIPIRKFCASCGCELKVPWTYQKFCSDCGQAILW